MSSVFAVERRAFFLEHIDDGTLGLFDPLIEIEQVQVDERGQQDENRPQADDKYLLAFGQGFEGYFYSCHGKLLWLRVPDLFRAYKARLLQLA